MIQTRKEDNTTVAHICIFYMSLELCGSHMCMNALCGYADVHYETFCQVVQHYRASTAIEGFYSPGVLDHFSVQEEWIGGQHHK